LRFSPVFAVHHAEKELRFDAEAAEHSVPKMTTISMRNMQPAMLLPENPHSATNPSPYIGFVAIQRTFGRL
jgi:hypothetical protein